MGKARGRLRCSGGYLLHSSLAPWGCYCLTAWGNPLPRELQSILYGSIWFCLEERRKKKKKKSKARLKSQKSRLLFFRGCKTSCLYSFGTDIEPPQFWLCCRERVSVAAQLHPLVPRVAEALLLHLSVLPVSSVLHPCAPSGDTCLHGFISAPSLSSSFPGEQHFLLVRAWGSRAAKQGVVPALRGCSWMLWLLLCFPGPAQASHIWWHPAAFWWRVTFRMLPWVTGGV